MASMRKAADDRSFMNSVYKPKVGFEAEAVKSQNTVKAAPKTTPKPKPVTGMDAVNKHQKEISPSGMASAKASQSVAIDKKYPGMFKKSRNTGRGE
jgi:hypothetical protein